MLEEMCGRLQVVLRLLPPIPRRHAMPFLFSGIEDFPFTHGRVFDCAHCVLPPLEFLRAAYDDILRDMDIMQSTPDFKLFGPLGTFDGHYDKQVHIAVGTCLTSRMRAKEYDRIRVELRHNSPDHLLDLLFR